MDDILAGILAKQPQYLHDAYLQDYNYKRYLEKQKDELKKKNEVKKEPFIKQMKLDLGD
jgi:hypothetical protein